MNLISTIKVASVLIVASILLAVSLFAGLMIATAGGAVYPPLWNIAAPLVCDGEFTQESHRYSSRPGQVRVQRAVYCTDAQSGVREEITLYTIFVAFLLYSGIIFVGSLVIIGPLIYVPLSRWRERKSENPAGWPAASVKTAWPPDRTTAAPKAPRVHARIIFNGQEYSSADEMPAAARAAYEQAMGVFADTDRNGVPDIFEAGGAQGRTAGQQRQVAADPAERLRKLRGLRDAGLITPQEYEAKKAEILSEM